MKDSVKNSLKDCLLVFIIIFFSISLILNIAQSKKYYELHQEYQWSQFIGHLWKQEYIKAVENKECPYYEEYKIQTISKLKDKGWVILEQF